MAIDEKRLQQLRKRKDELEKQHDCRVGNPLMLNDGTVIWYRETPTSKSYRQYTKEIGRQVVASSSGGESDISPAQENLVIRNVLDPEPSDARKILDDHYWCYGQIATELQKVTQSSEFVDLDPKD